MCAKCNQYTRTSEHFIQNIIRNDNEPEVLPQGFANNSEHEIDGSKIRRRTNEPCPNTTSTPSARPSNSGSQSDNSNDSSMSTSHLTAKKSIKKIKSHNNKVYTWVGFTSCFLGMLYLFFRNNIQQIIELKHLSTIEIINVFLTKNIVFLLSISSIHPSLNTHLKFISFWQLNIMKMS